MLVTLFSMCAVDGHSCVVLFFLMIRRPPRSTQSRSSAASDVYKRQDPGCAGDSALTVGSRSGIVLATMRGRAVAARRAHNPEVAGSNPAPAMIHRPQSGRLGSCFFSPCVGNDWPANGSRAAPPLSNQIMIEGVHVGLVQVLNQPVERNAALAAFLDGDRVERLR